MSTTSTIALARKALFDALNSGELQDKAFYAWSGALADKPEVAWIDDVPNGTWTSEIAGIKAGRKHRQEQYVFEVVVWVAQRHGSYDAAQATFERAVELSGVVEDGLADDTQLGETNVQWMVLEERNVDLIPLEKGWGCQIILQVEGNARVT